jgi:hypothetical protein
MVAPRPAGRGSAVKVLMTLGIAAAFGRPAAGQIQLPDPYLPESAQYLGYAYPGYRMLPGGNRPTYLPPAASANQLERYYQSVESPSLGDGLDAFGAGSNGSRFGRGMGRSLSLQDQAFYDAQRERDMLYFRALGETDPKKRAEMLKQVNELTKKPNEESRLARYHRAGAKPRVSADGSVPSSGIRGTLQANGAPRSAFEPEAPPLPFNPYRSSPYVVGLPSPESERTPSEVLDRSRQMDQRSRAPEIPVPGLRNRNRESGSERDDESSRNARFRRVMPTPGSGDPSPPSIAPPSDRTPRAPAIPVPGLRSSSPR